MEYMSAVVKLPGGDAIKPPLMKAARKQLNKMEPEKLEGMLLTMQGMISKVVDLESNDFEEMMDGSEPNGNSTATD